MIARRGVLAVPLLASQAARGALAGPGSAAEAARTLADLERRHGGRLGVAILGAGAAITPRGDERFAMCSTFVGRLAARV